MGGTQVASPILVLLLIVLLGAHFFTSYITFNWQSDINAQLHALRSRVSQLEAQLRRGGMNPGAAPLSLDTPQQTPGSLQHSPGLPAASEYLFEVSPANIITSLEGPSGEKTRGGEEDRQFYGGKGDPAHLGGFTEDDRDGQSPSLWTWMMKHLTVKSVVDVGCGRGISTKWFQDHGAKVLCVEGSGDAVRQSKLSKDVIVQHDFSKGPWWPSDTFDVAWAVEFVEHVGRHYMQNYLPIFKRAALVFVTHSYWGGWHHVEVHGDYWWRARMEMHGFVYSSELTKMAHSMAEISSSTHRAQHLGGPLQVFINPEVASLPKHAHLVGMHGCFGHGPCGYRGSCECKGPDRLPAQFQPVYNAESEYDAQINITELKVSTVLADRRDYKGKVASVDLSQVS